jgi:CHRD domain
MPSRVPLSLLVAALALCTASAASGDQRTRNLRAFANLQPLSEVPALSSTGSGRFKATIDVLNQTITYELSYQDLEAPPAQAHIHIGQRGVNGMITVFLCGNPPSVPAAEVPQPPACPPSPATVTGTLTAANIIGPAAQGIEPTSSTVNEFEELVEMLRSGRTYANVHSSKFPSGEIRGQVHVDSKH